MSAATGDTAFQSFCTPTGLRWPPLSRFPLSVERHLVCELLRPFERVAGGLGFTELTVCETQDINEQRRRRLRLADEPQADSVWRTAALSQIHQYLPAGAQAPRLGEESSTVPCVLFAETMMNSQERRIIDDLFDKLREVERQSGHREPLAEARIRAHIEAQPAAPYYMAQTIVMLEQALRKAQARLEDLERELATGPANRGFLSSLLGAGQSQARSDCLQGYTPRTVNSPSRPGALWGAPGPDMTAQPGRAGFLSGAAQTAMGVAGGVLLGSMLGSLGTGQANAMEASKPGPEATAAEDSGDDFGGGFSEDI
jgi:hypothetical protein